MDIGQMGAEPGAFLQDHEGCWLISAGRDVDRSPQLTEAGYRYRLGKANEQGFEVN
jgi:hypothetical protein